MSPWDDLRLVSGYLREIDHLPKAAIDFGLLRRVAVVLNDGNTPHSPMYWDLVEALIENLLMDSVIFEIDIDKGPLIFTSFASMRECVAGRPELAVPFSRATLSRSGRVHALIHVEPWAMIGGPFPYSDSWTFAIYRETDDVKGLRDACYRVCAQHGLPILEEMCGLVAPEKSSLWKCMVRWLFR